MDIGESPNILDDKSIEPLCNLVEMHKNLKYFSILNNNLSIESIEKLINFIPNTMTVHLKQTIFKDTQYTTSTIVTNHTKEEIMNIRHAPHVWHIESVYRNSM